MQCRYNSFFKKQLKPTSHNSWISWPACSCWWIGILVNQKSPGGTNIVWNLCDHAPKVLSPIPPLMATHGFWEKPDSGWLLLAASKKNGRRMEGRPGNGVKLFVGTARFICGSWRIVWEKGSDICVSMWVELWHKVIIFYQVSHIQFLSLIQPFWEGWCIPKRKCVYVSSRSPPDFHSWIHFDFLVF